MKPSLVQLWESNETAYHAGMKAPSDVHQIVSQIGAHTITVRRRVWCGRMGRFLSCLSWLLEEIRVLLHIPIGSNVFVQYPCGTFLSGRLGFHLLSLIKRLRKAKIVVLIHDIDDIRNEKAAVGDSLIRLFAVADYLIVHNDAMAGWIRERGNFKGGVVTLGIFDYLHKCSVGAIDWATAQASVIVAGNLDVNKAGYIRDFGKIRGVRWNLYGVNYNFEVRDSDNIIYHGSVHPDELPSRLVQGFGLVWDGPTGETCAGGTGRYLKYNNPHKMSLYLASGHPVIIWTGAAQAGFVKENAVGVCVDRISDIPMALQKLSPEERLWIADNVRKIGERLRSGAYTRDAVSQFIGTCE